MTVQIIRGNALQLPLADDSVDLICTSPPYFGLRSYTDAGEHYDGQIGSEPTPAEFLDALIAATAEMVRVVKPSGSIWVNLGDKYSDRAAPQWRGSSDRLVGRPWKPRRASSTDMAPRKSLLGLPWRYAIRCIDELGLILRAEVIWSKPNGLPESVTDRVRRSHEQWFHFTLQPRYYSAVDEIREPHDTADRTGSRSSYKPGQTSGNTLGGHSTKSDAGLPLNPLGKLPGSVWTVPTQPLTVPAELGVDHFAAFPMEWPRRIITGWSPRAVCDTCGFLLGSTYDNGMQGVRKTVAGQRKTGPPAAVLRPEVLESVHLSEPGEHPGMGAHVQGVHRATGPESPDGGPDRVRHGAPSTDGRSDRADADAGRGGASPEWDQGRQSARESGTAGEDRPRPNLRSDAKVRDRLPILRSRGSVERECPHCGSTETRQAVICDPFGGTGTTTLVAHALGRHGVTVDMSADYCRIAEWRTSDPGQLAAAMQVDKPAPVPDGQLSLLEAPA